MVLAVLVAGCGGSSSHKARGAASSAPPPARKQSAPRTASYPQTTSHTSTAGASNVRLPATFTIGPGGELTPTSVAAPAGVLIDLTMISGDGRTHRVSVGTKALVVPAGGRTSAVLQGLHAGRYPVIVDAARRGTLVVGGSVGP